MRHPGCPHAGTSAYGRAGSGAGNAGRCDHSSAIPGGGYRTAGGSNAGGYPGAGGNGSGAGRRTYGAGRCGPADGNEYATAAGVSSPGIIPGPGAIAHTAAAKVGAHPYGRRRGIAAGDAVPGLRHAHALGSRRYCRPHPGGSGNGRHRCGQRAPALHNAPVRRQRGGI